MNKYVVYDLEMCKVPKGAPREQFGSASELIQIGAILLDEEYNEIDSFMSYVKPEYGMLDKFIIDLTGITEADLKDAPGAAEALSAFVDWMPEDAIMVSWSGNDEAQIFREIDGKGIDNPALEDMLYDSIDCQIEFENRIDASHPYALAEALAITGIDCETAIHDALVDARNTALLFAKLQREPVLEMSKYYMSENDMNSFFRGNRRS